MTPGPRLSRESPGHGNQETVYLRGLNRWQADHQREDLADLHVECYEQAQGEEYRSREEFLRRLVNDVQRPGFDLVLAEQDTLVGCTFGFPVDRNGSWWRGFRGRLPQDVERLTASGHVFVVAELMVHPYHQHQGVGLRLLQELLTWQHATLGVILLDPANDAAGAASRSWGWQEIGEVRMAPGAPVLRVLTRPVDQRTSARPSTLAHDSHSQRPE
jgi:GNAT superfamily N-acetyltransferase